eukprot:SAG25_NODE_12134_length_287_cov_0.510638_1_plen_32_part_01
MATLLVEPLYSSLDTYAWFIKTRLKACKLCIP